MPANLTERNQARILDAVPQPPVSPDVDVIIRRANELDRRRRLQVDQQRQVINRLLNGGSLSDAFTAQQDELVFLRAKVERVLDALIGRRGSTTAKWVVAVLEGAEEDRFPDTPPETPESD